VDTTIGQQFSTSRWRKTLALTVAALAVTTDLAFLYSYRVLSDANQAAADHYENIDLDYRLGGFFRPSYHDVLRAHDASHEAWKAAVQAYNTSNEVRAIVFLAAVLALLGLARGDRATLGLVEAPFQGWRYWGRAGAVACLLTWAVALPLAAVWLLLGWDIHTTWNGKLEDFNEALANSLIRAPVMEEVAYRVVVCVPVAACLGGRTAILVSGVLFSLIHVFYGNPNPLNLIAGFFLAWTFVKSGTVLIPMLIHILGNAFFLYAQLLLITIQPSPVP
jgi:membrane protease YdiL (CAAX protease family)